MKKSVISNELLSDLANLFNTVSDTEEYKLKTEKSKMMVSVALNLALLSILYFNSK